MYYDYPPPTYLEYPILIAQGERGEVTWRPPGVTCVYVLCDLSCCFIKFYSYLHLFALCCTFPLHSPRLVNLIKAWRSPSHSHVHVLIFHNKVWHKSIGPLSRLTWAGPGVMWERDLTERGIRSPMTSIDPTATGHASKCTWVQGT